MLWLVRYRDKRGRRVCGFIYAPTEQKALQAAVKAFGMDIISIFPKGI